MDRNSEWKNNVRILGVVEEFDDILYLKWSASGIEFETFSESIEIECVAEYNLIEESPYLKISVYTEHEIIEKKSRIEVGKSKIKIYDNLKKEKVKIRIMKLTEEQYGKVGISSLLMDDVCIPTRELERKIIFIGDSITAAYGVEGINGVSTFSTADQDVSKSYAYLSSEYLNAECRIFAYSGNGIISRWIPENQELPNTDQLLPEIIPFVQEYDPSLIVCNLGTNDASYTRRNVKREQEFSKSYLEFIRKLQKHFKDVPILIIYGIMEKSLSKCIKEIAEESGVFYFELPLQKEEDGLGTDAHPGEKIQRELSYLLSKEIRKIMVW